MSKISIIGDAHFGAAYNMGKTDLSTQLNTRLLDFANTFNSIIDAHIAMGVKIVVLTGDNFETRHPTASQHKVFSQCIQRAVDLGLIILINVGNHDQQRHIDTTTVDMYNALRVPNVYVYQNMDIYSIKDDLHIVILPYRDRKMLGGETNSESIEILRKQFSALTKNLKGKIVVVGHFMLEKGVDSIDPDMFSMNELILPLDIFSKCDVVIMGHVHKHSFISSEKPVVIYSGSMEKVSFGEKDHHKVSLIINPDDIHNVKVLQTKVRDLYEINLDYVGDDKEYKDKINNKILSDIKEFEKTSNLKNSICKISIRIKETDLYYIDQSLIKDYVINQGVHFCTGIQVSSVNNRQLRNGSINETLSEKKAMAAFIESLQETDQTKKRLLKYSDQIIEEIGEIKQ